MKYQLKRTPDGRLFATGDRARAEKDGASYRDPQRFALIDGELVPKLVTEPEPQIEGELVTPEVKPPTPSSEVKPPTKRKRKRKQSEEDPS